jgi:ubiquinone/menaquinone biosynthesis C-methylase UbiE
VDIAEYRQASHEIWQQMAAGWDGWNDWLAEASRPATDQMVDALAPKPGETILELAAGAGVAGFLAASVRGGEGRLIMTDFSEQMVEAERRRGAALGVSGVEYRVMDAEQIDLEDESVDGVLCRWGYMLMADPAKALRETHRVLRPGGRLSFSVWGAPEDNPWASVPGRILVQRGHMPAPESDAPGIFAMANPQRIVELVTGAGFDNPDLVEVPMAWHFVLAVLARHRGRRGDGAAAARRASECRGAHRCAARARAAGERRRLRHAGRLHQRAGVTRLVQVPVGDVVSHAASGGVVGAA